MLRPCVFLFFAFTVAVAVADQSILQVNSPWPSSVGLGAGRAAQTVPALRSPKLAWSHPPLLTAGNFDTNSFVGPVVDAEGRVWVSALGDLYAFDSKTGQLLHNTTVNNSLFCGNAVAELVATNAGVMFSCGSGIAFGNYSDGAILLQNTVGTDTPLFPSANGLVPAGSSSFGGVFQVSDVFGRSLWQFVTCRNGNTGKNLPYCGTDGNGSFGPIGLNNDLLVVGLQNCSIFAVETVTGVLRWEYSLLAIDPGCNDGGGMDIGAMGGATFSDDGKVVLLATDSYQVVALDTKTGSLLWKFALQSKEINGGVCNFSCRARAPPSISHDGSTFYVGTVGSTVTTIGFLCAGAMSTGKQLWCTTGGPNGAYSFLSPVVVLEKGLYVVGSGASTNVLLSLDPATGKELFTLPLPLPAMSNVQQLALLADGSLVISSNSLAVFVFSEDHTLTKAVGAISRPVVVPPTPRRRSKSAPSAVRGVPAVDVGVCSTIASGQVVTMVSLSCYILPVSATTTGFIVHVSVPNILFYMSTVVVGPVQGSSEMSFVDFSASAQSFWMEQSQWANQQATQISFSIDSFGSALSFTAFDHLPVPVHVGVPAQISLSSVSGSSVSFYEAIAPAAPSIFGGLRFTLSRAAKVNVEITWSWSGNVNQPSAYPHADSNGNSYEKYTGLSVFLSPGNTTYAYPSLVGATTPQLVYFSVVAAGLQDGGESLLFVDSIQLEDFSLLSNGVTVQGMWTHARLFRLEKVVLDKPVHLSASGLNPVVWLGTPRWNPSALNWHQEAGVALGHVRTCCANDPASYASNESLTIYPGDPLLTSVVFFVYDLPLQPFRAQGLFNFSAPYTFRVWQDL